MDAVPDDIATVRRIARADGALLACRPLSGRGPTLVFLPGYMSDMSGGKASALLAWAAAQGRACLLLDYAGCGLSGGDFAVETLTSWRDDVIGLIDTVTPGPVVLVGSSMGGWLMLLVALAMPGRVAGMVGTAAAPDFTDWGFNDGEKAIIATEGLVQEATPDSDRPYLTTRKFWQDGQANRLLDTPVALDCPVRLLHGQRDADVPWEVSLRLAAALKTPDVRVILIKDGDHRLSRDSDIALLIATVGELLDSA